MIVEVKLTVDDYHNIMNWFELAFAKNKPYDIPMKEHLTIRKISVMVQAKLRAEEDER